MFTISRFWFRNCFSPAIRRFCQARSPVVHTAVSFSITRTSSVRYGVSWLYQIIERCLFQADSEP
jgi:hypothetical protein